MSYIDGFVLIVKKGKLKEYKKMASEAGKIWMKHGALQYIEAVGDDLNPDMSMGEHKYKTTNFPKIAKSKKGEYVFFSYIVYKNKKHRNEVNKKVMKEMMESHKNDPNQMKNIPFDMKRMSFGGFKTIVEY